MFRNMTEADWKEFFQKESDLEVEQLMNQINSVPELQNIKAPMELRDSIFKKIGIKKQWEKVK